MDIKNNTPATMAKEMPTWWDDRCEYDGMIFTPLIIDGAISMTAEEMRNKWIMDKSVPTTPQPDTPYKPTLDQRTAALEAAMLAMMGGVSDV